MHEYQSIITYLDKLIQEADKALTAVPKDGKVPEAFARLRELRTARKVLAEMGRKNFDP